MRTFAINTCALYTETLHKYVSEEKHFSNIFDNPDHPGFLQKKGKFPDQIVKRLISQKEIVHSIVKVYPQIVKVTFTSISIVKSFNPNLKSLFTSPIT